MAGLATTLVIIACQVVQVGPPDETTHYVPLEWKYVDAEMQCKREAIPLEDAAELNGAKPIPHDFSNVGQCAKAALTFAPDWNRSHPGWAVYKVGCPRPIVDQNGHLLGLHLPECPIGIRCKFDESVI